MGSEETLNFHICLPDCKYSSSNLIGHRAHLNCKQNLEQPEYNPNTQTASVTWNSKPGNLYAIWVSEDGTEWSDIDDAYPSQGEQTTFNEIDSSSKYLLIRISVSE